METVEVVSPESGLGKSNRFHILAWLNNLLKTSFKNVEETSSGACHCQIMDCVMPGSVDMSKVKFQAESVEDYEHNFNLLQEAFNKRSITKIIPVKELIENDFKCTLGFLKWFKVFFSTNVKDEEYDPLKARNGQDISPVVFHHKTKRSPSSESNFYLSFIDMGKDGTIMNRKPVCYDDKWKETYDWVEPSTLGELYTYCRVCDVNLNTFHTGLFDLKRHVETNKHRKKYRLAQQANLKSGNEKPPPCSEAAIQFIHKHCYSGSAGADQVSSHFARYMLGLQYPKDIVSVCQHTPFCVYIYGGVALGENDTVSVILIGFFDVKASRHCIRLLDALQSPAGDAGDQTAAAVVDTLKKFGFPAANLAAFYLDGTGTASEQICSQLRELNPNIVALGGLYGLADAACRAGVMELSNQAQEMIVDIHAHYTSCSTKDDNLKALFGCDSDIDSQSFHLNTSCLNFCQLVKKILGMWTDLTSYFSTCDKDDDKAKLICSQLQDPKLRATFMFLDQTMKPLQAFQNHLQTQEGAARADLVHILEEASALLHAYASSFLHPQAIGCFLKERDSQILKNKKFHLSGAELSLGGSAVEDFLKECEAAEALPLLQDEVLSFYVALTSSIAEELPLTDGLLKSMAQLLSPQSRLKVTGNAVGELGTKLGICSSPEEVNQLTAQFLEYQLAEEGEREKEEKEKSALVSLEKHWAGVLEDTEPTSMLRKLVLTLLSLPCPPLGAQQVFTKALENGDAALFSDGDGDGDVTTESEQESVHDVEMNSDSALSDCTSNKDSLINTDNKEKTDNGVYALLFLTCENVVEFQGKDTSPARKTTLSPRIARRALAYQDGKGFLTGELVWGKVKGFSWWPGMVMPWKTKLAPPAMRRVEWFGDGMFSEIYTNGLLPFSAFQKCFCKNSYASLPTYKDAIYQIIELAGERCGKSFTEAAGNKEEELKLMLDWAFGGFLPTGPDGFTPPNSTSKTDSSDSALSDYQPPAKRKYVHKAKVLNETVSYNRESMIKTISEKGKKIEDFCLSCGSSETEVHHPLFEGSLCLKCKENFIETLYRYDEDGYQSYCTVCCAGLEVILCGNASCCRCFCKDCLDILVGPATFEKLKDVDPWSCFICLPSQCNGNLKLRPDWSIKVQEFFVNNSAMEFEPHRVYPSIPAHQRWFISLCVIFDILKHVKRSVCALITPVLQLAEWGPFDLLIGGSPCNDLSMVNPARKGLFEGTGRLFFEFYRMLTMMRPREDDDRPFFWLFENVVFMSANDKNDICRFLECNPILIDAVRVSPAHRARYFWGNLPGMNRPLATALDDKVSLQDCLEVGRVATVEPDQMIKTWSKTLISNSIRQGKMGPLPVNMNGKEDYLWCTEIEQIFGFPKHYTDVNNMGRGQRQKVLGRSWSVPVIRHLFAPLKDYFECE
uniref:DNA (cytosine-5-)-methyltransferase n=1 Tax=Myripristis murdjan TaxID=586833 RepID=A0A667XES9_9TELE